MEEAGITQKIIGVAGASVGAITAALFAVGFTANELKEFMETDLRKVLVGKFPTNMLGFSYLSFLGVLNLLLFFNIQCKESSTKLC